MTRSNIECEVILSFWANTVGQALTNAKITISSSRDLSINADVEGTYQFYLGAQYYDDPDPNHITYSPIMTINVVNCVSTSALAAASGSPVVK